MYSTRVHCSKLILSQEDEQKTVAYLHTLLYQHPDGYGAYPVQHDALNLSANNEEQVLLKDGGVLEKENNRWPLIHTVGCIG